MTPKVETKPKQYCCGRKKIFFKNGWWQGYVKARGKKDIRDSMKDFLFFVFFGQIWLKNQNRNSKFLLMSDSDTEEGSNMDRAVENVENYHVVVIIEKN